MAEQQELTRTSQELELLRQQIKIQTMKFLEKNKITILDDGIANGVFTSVAQYKEYLARRQKQREKLKRSNDGW